MRVPIYLLLFCTAMSCDGALPTREQSAGNCTAESDCSASGQVCKANHCAACTAHTDCRSQVCDSYGDLGGAGTCVAASNIIYVDSSPNNDAVCQQRQSPATGKQDMPFCDLLAAFAQLTKTPGKILRILPSPDTYTLPPIDTTTGPVTLIGSGLFIAGKAVSLAEGGTTGDQRLQLGMGASLVLDGVDIFLDGMVVAPSSKLTIRRSLMTYAMRGATFGDGSTVTLDRDTISMSTLGFNFTKSTVNITNSFFSGNFADPTTGLLNFSGGSGTFQFNTVAYNMPTGTSTASAINCANASTLKIKNSIFVQNSVSRQLSSGCMATPNSVIVGMTDPIAGQIKQEPVFEDPTQLDLRLKAQDPTNIQYVIDRAVEVDPATEKYVDHDYYGTPRPQGSGYDIGAFESTP